MTDRNVHPVLPVCNVCGKPDAVPYAES